MSSMQHEEGIVSFLKGIVKSFSRGGFCFMKKDSFSNTWTSGKELTSLKVWLFKSTPMGEFHWDCLHFAYWDIYSYCWSFSSTKAACSPTKFFHLGLMITVEFHFFPNQKCWLSCITHLHMWSSYKTQSPSYQRTTYWVAP